ncbi:MAG: ABC transporter substrate-binding protein [Bacillota bacterium]|jgi:ABC-type glycerol-3-phosphate transport system substrate-binding protein|nr:extracellular solute-binding protein [Bacillota bacterium]NLU55392.1 extracellular solute-binding protein [Bacillota bacterium]HOA90319.1 extracellular solute-binding protein [Bacillota bacterium]HPT60595.1 extracellular solute-binding protein [Bacillota bacterium]HPZ72495.1 extracellular solute-binding protein [Bacillota bacterium]
MRLKKVLLAGLVVLVLCSAFTSAATKITVWMTYGGTMGEVVARLIEEDFTPKTGIEVEYVPMLATPDLMTKLILEILGGTAPDVCSLEGWQVIELGMRGALETMNQFSDYQQIVDRFFPGFSGQFIYNNKVYALPGESSWTQTYVRTDIFQELGLAPAATWDEIPAIITKLKARDMEFYYFTGGGQPRTLMNFTFQRGHDIFTPDGLASNLNHPEVIKAFTTYTDLYTKYGVPLEMPDYQTFTTGEVPYMVHLHYIYGLIDNAAPHIKGKWEPVHTPGTLQADGTINHAVPTSSFGYVIPKYNQNQAKKDAAWEFLKWYTSDETLAKMQKGFFEGPDRWVLAFGTRDSFQSAPFYEEHRELINEVVAAGRSMTSIPGGYSTYRYIDFAYNQVVLQGIDPKEAMEQAAKDSTAELERKRKEFARFLVDM